MLFTGKNPPGFVRIFFEGQRSSSVYINGPSWKPEGRFLWLGDLKLTSLSGLCPDRRMRWPINFAIPNPPLDFVMVSGNPGRWEDDSVDYLSVNKSIMAPGTMNSNNKSKPTSHTKHNSKQANHHKKY